MNGPPQAIADQVNDTGGRRYRGHAQAARPAEDPVLTHVGPGTPCGEYWRRFWFPVAMAEELTDLPLGLRILGEDLVLFRDGSDRYGLLHRHCSHRNTSLEFGIVEEQGIRCCYHGWHYDIDGTILETPGEPAASKIKDRVVHGAYPAVAYNGLIFTYMGPTEERPEFPLYDTLALPDVELLPYSISYPCNWLQVAENTMDPIHGVFLHSRVTQSHFGSTWSTMPLFRYGETAHRITAVKTRRVGDRIWVSSQETVLPSFSQIGALWEEGTEEKYFTRASLSKWTVPIDDDHCKIVGLRHFSDAVDPKGLGQRDRVGKETVDFEGQTGGRPYEERQRFPNDYEAQVSQGPINPHARENLASHDEGVALLRQNLLRGIEALARGERVPQSPRPGGTVPSCVQDSVLPIPPRSGEDDWALLEAVTDAVMGVVFAGEAHDGDERTALIDAALRKIKHDPRFATSPAPEA